MTLILAIFILAALAIFRNLWVRTGSAPAELRIHVSFLAFGYTLLIGAALQESVRVIARRLDPELRVVTVLRAIAAIAATGGFIYGIIWATKYGRYDALQRPVGVTDLLVIALAWFVSARAFMNRPTAYWDIPLGLGALSSWYLSALA